MIAYKQHYACFECRKSFKRRLLSDISENHNEESKPFKCPQCKSEMAAMGLDFKAPKTTNTKEWKTLESLYEISYVFHSCGCNGPGYRPRNERAFLEFLKKVKQDRWSTFQYWKNYRSQGKKDELNKEKALDITRKKYEELCLWINENYSKNNI